MHEGLYIAAAGGIKQMKKLDIISNNLANVNDVGFKKDQLVFESLLTPFKEDLSFENSQNAFLSPALSNESAAYVGVSDFSTDHSQGPLTRTENPLNVALDGDGFFTVRTDAGTRYTRKGDFKLDSKNQLVTQSGHAVLDDKGQPMTLDTANGQITIDASGSVSLTGGLGSTPVAKLKVVDFKDKSRLVKEGAGLYRKADPNTEEITPTATTVRQGFLEGSNVNTMADMTNMIQALRSFESYQKVIQTIDRINNESVNTIGRVG